MTTQQYFRRYYELLPKYKNGETAYIALEEEYFSLYKRIKYISYNSFRKAKSNYFGQY